MNTSQFLQTIATWATAQGFDAEPELTDMPHGIVAMMVVDVPMPGEGWLWVRFYLSQCGQTVVWSLHDLDPPTDPRAYHLAKMGIVARVAGFMRALPHGASGVAA